LNDIWSILDIVAVVAVLVIFSLILYGPAVAVFLGVIGLVRYTFSIIWEFLAFLAS